MSVQLGDGTQTILLKDAPTALCRCGRPLSWEYLSHAQLSATAECECGMAYTAWLATVKIEGINRGID